MRPLHFPRSCRQLTHAICVRRIPDYRLCRTYSTCRTCISILLAIYAAYTLIDFIRQTLFDIAIDRRGADTGSTRYGTKHPTECTIIHIP